MTPARPAAVSQASAWLLPVAAVLCLGATAGGVWLYPFARVELGLGLLAYAAIGYWRPTLLLLMLPPWLTLVNLAPWSGSLYLEDYDLVLGATLGVLLARGLYATRIRMTPAQKGFLGLLILSYLIALWRGLWPLPDWSPAELSTYYSRWHALRIGKGFFWALCLLPGLVALLRHDHRRTRHDMAWGLALAGLAIGLVALWERGVLYALFSGQDRYAVFKGLLDFTSRYRVTGVFSEMHTGGEAIDGFIALIWPFGILAAFHARSRWLVGLAALSLAGVLYAGVTTFSRATYAALVVGMAVAGLLWLYSYRKRHVMQRHARWEALPGLLPPLLMPYLYMRGGMTGLALGLLLWGVAVLAGGMSASARRGAAAWAWPSLAVLAAILCLVALARQLLQSTAVENTPAQAWLLAAVAAGLGGGGGFWAGWRLAPASSPRFLAMVTALLVGSVGIITPAFLGGYMAERTADNAQDFEIRLAHWRRALALMPDDPWTHLVGMGSGAFPSAYLWSGKPVHMGSYRFVPDQGGYFLELGGGQDARMTQRLSLPAFGSYTLSMDVRTDDPRVWLRVRLYRRNMILLSDWPGPNVTLQQHVLDTKGAWRRLSWTFNLGPVGDDGSLGRQPLLIEIMNFRKYDYMLRPATLLDVDNVSLKDEGGRELLANGDFGRGMERWFPYYDFNHLPWHVKNLWVNLYFEQGALGVLGFAGFVGVTLLAAVRRARAADPWGIGVSAAVASYLAVGMFGGLLDMPRIIFICWLMLFLTALTGPVRARLGGPKSPPA
ncbi:MAG: hypothetical protein AB1831_09560 [Pseudomonadota bacterium]